MHNDPNEMQQHIGNNHFAAQFWMLAFVLGIVVIARYKTRASVKAVFLHVRDIVSAHHRLNLRSLTEAQIFPSSLDREPYRVANARSKNPEAAPSVIFENSRRVFPCHHRRYSNVNLRTRASFCRSREKHVTRQCRRAQPSTPGNVRHDHLFRPAGFQVAVSYA